MASLNDLKNRYYNYNTNVIPNLEQAFSNINSAITEFNNLKIILSNALTIEGDNSIKNLQDNIKTELENYKGKISSEKQKAISRRSTLYYQIKNKEKEGN